MKYEIVPYDNYFDAIKSDIEIARSRIHIEGMTLDNGHDMSPILESIGQQAMRGVDCRIMYDRFSWLTSFSEGWRGPRDLRSRLNTLSDSGVAIAQVGLWKPNIYSGRHHPKMTIVDDTVYSFGGINPQTIVGGCHDYMLKAKDRALSDYLWDSRMNSATERGSHEEHTITDEDRLLVDGGEAGESIIYDAACELVREADKIIYVSKLSPSGKLADILAKKDVWYATNTLSTATNADKLALLLDKIRYGSYNNAYKASIIMHAKCIIGQTADGRLEAITGSHNFSQLGVSFGTQELALHTKNQVLCRQLLEYIDADIAHGCVAHLETI